MKLRDDSGRTLDAPYDIETDALGLALIMESGNGKHGPQPPRHRDYNDALTILLERLGQLGAVLTDALVDAQVTQRQRVPEHARRIISGRLRHRQLHRLADRAGHRAARTGGRAARPVRPRGCR